MLQLVLGDDIGMEPPDRRTRLEVVTELILRLVDERQAIRPRDVEAMGIPRRYLTVLSRLRGPIAC